MINIDGRDRVIPVELSHIHCVLCLVSGGSEEVGAYCITPLQIPVSLGAYSKEGVSLRWLLVNSEAFCASIFLDLWVLGF